MSCLKALAMLTSIAIFLLTALSNLFSGPIIRPEKVVVGSGEYRACQAMEPGFPYGPHFWAFAGNTCDTIEWAIETHTTLIVK